MDCRPERSCIVIVRQIVKGRTVKIVTIDEAPAAGEDDRAIEDFALAAAGETRSSTFGIDLGWFSQSPGTVQATIHTD